MRRSLAISSTSRYRCLLLLASLLAFWLSGCVEVVQHSRVHDAGLVSIKFTALIGPQYEARVLPEIKKELVTKLSAGVDFTSLRRGTTFRATAGSFAFNFGGIGKSGSAAATTGVPSWLMPVSIAAICVGIALLLIGWFRSRQTSHSRALPHAVAVATPSMPMPAPTEDAGSVFCTACGVRNALGRKFCNQCGHDLG